MKMKRWMLYAVATVCFIGCFIGLNTKYDPFYRVNGINNENRVLIELYLDEQEQEYLIDSAISMDLFVQYMHYDDFYLPNYSYYIKLDKANIIKNEEEMIIAANTIIDRLDALNEKTVSTTFDSLVSNNLILAFLESEEFNPNNIMYYQIVRSLYDDLNYDYIEDTNGYLSMLDIYDYALTQELLDDTLNILVNSYDEESLNLLLTTSLLQGQSILLDPSELGVVIDETTYIASYSPMDLVIATDIPRMLYTTYLQNDTYQALQSLYEQVVEQLGDVFLLTEGYQSYNSLVIKEDTSAGFNVYQTGMCIDILELGTSASLYSTTELYTWMDENAYSYGFIQEEEGTTTYRYVGIENALIMHQLEYSLEDNEYIAR